MADKDTKRVSYLLKNTAIFAIGNIATKFISFFMVPLYTNALTTAEYGTVDLISTVCTVLAPILILNISESVMRFSLDKGADYSQILSIGLFVYFIAILVGLLIFPVSAVFEITREYSAYIYLYVIASAGSQLFLCYLRGKELLSEYTFGGVLSTLITVCLNVLFLVKFHLGVKGYLSAMIISSFVTMVYAIWAGKAWRVLGKFSLPKNLFGKMVRYSAVLIPNTFMWWIMNASDRVMLTAMIGASVNGIYAVSYKLPTLVSTLTTVFNQAWSYSAIKESGAEDETEFNNRVLNMLTSFSMCIGIGLLTIIKPFLKIYVATSYYEAWKYTPFLTIGCVYMALGTFISTSYNVNKDSWGYLYSATFGAMFNVVLNFILIPHIGAYGAAIATCISYIAVFVFRVFNTRKYMHYNVLTKEFIVGTILLLITSAALYLPGYTGIFVQLTVAIITCCFYSKEIFLVLNNIRRK